MRDTSTFAGSPRATFARTSRWSASRRGAAATTATTATPATTASAIGRLNSGHVHAQLFCVALHVRIEGRSRLDLDSALTTSNRRRIAHFNGFRAERFHLVEKCCVHWIGCLRRLFAHAEAQL